MASGVIEANRTGGTVKRLHCGLAAQAGVTAAQLVRRGFTGPPTVLEGRFGFFEAWLHGQFFPAAVTDGPRHRVVGAGHLLQALPGQPLHPHHRSTPAARSASAASRPEHVASVIDRRRRPRSIRTIGEPIEVKRAPETGYQAQFSGPYAFTAGLFGGGGLGLGLDDFTDELAQDPARRALMAKVERGRRRALRRRSTRSSSRPSSR